MPKMAITIELEDLISFRRGGKKGMLESGAVMNVNPTELSPAILAELVYHAIKQKVGDAAAGVDGDEVAARAKMTKVWNALLAGDWSTRGEAAHDPLASVRKYIREIIRRAMSAKQKAAYKKAEDKNAFVDELFEKQTDATQDKIVLRAEAMRDNAREELDLS